MNLGYVIWKPYWAVSLPCRSDQYIVHRISIFVKRCVQLLEKHRPEEQLARGCDAIFLPTVRSPLDLPASWIFAVV